MRKKTRHWCRGKRGVPHKLVVRDYLAIKRGHRCGDRLYGEGGKILLCSVCGKEFGTYIPWRTSRGLDEQVIPDWVTNPPAEP